MNKNINYINIDDAHLCIHKNIIDEVNPTIIFLHDSLGCIELWRDFPQRLGDVTQSNVLIYDQQGYGKSSSFSEKERKVDYLEKEAHVLSQIITQLNLQNTILFGHSDGGSTALIAAAKSPKLIKAIITEGVHIFVEAITLKDIKEAVETYKITNLKERLEKYHGDKTEELFWA